ncbi:basal cell adhesion molecule isoform X3 [Alligator mississippiensis]|uniref:basal cell adhesion molecule isoform X3 n=1 Tax=Alligator mississippiensis TaxID=8496 RepID=UPI002877B2FB|nr:basal cell adhesion molecule isoform X3 [Alligator mississippiensis]
MDTSARPRLRPPLPALLLLLLLLPGTRAAVQVQVQVPALVETELGARVTIPCSYNVSGRAGPPLVEWFITERSGERRRVAFTEGGRSAVDTGTEYTGRLVLDPHHGLELEAASLADERVFSCQVTAGTAGSAEGTAQVRVYATPEPPEVRVNPWALSVTESSASEVATCISRNGHPLPTLTWSKDGDPLDTPPERNDELYAVLRSVREASGLRSASSTLYLRPRKRDRAARFRCHVTFPRPHGPPGRTASSPFTLVLHYYTENVNFTLESPHGGITKEGDDVVLRCHGDGYPSQAYTFNTVEGRDLGTSADGRLALPRVTRADTGTYRCRVLDFDSPPEVQLERELSLHVHYLDTPVLQPSKMATVPLGGDLELRCAATGSEAPQLAWKKGQDWLGPGPVHTLRTVSYSDAGPYTCEAAVPSVPGLQRNDTVHIVVEGPPKMEDPEPVFGREGDLVRLSCQAQGHPLPHITWSLHDVTPEDSGAEGHVNSTVWVQMTPELANDGVRCHAHNRYGEAETSFSLRIRGPLAGPGAAVVAVVVCVLVLLLVVGCFYGLQRRRHLPCRGGGEKRSLTPRAGGVTAPGGATELRPDGTEQSRGLLSPGGGPGPEC